MNEFPKRSRVPINKQADEAAHFKGFQQNKRNYSWRYGNVMKKYKIVEDVTHNLTY
jgi:hypothetical protein